MIKKIIGISAMLMALSSVAYAGTITDATSVSLGTSGILFSVSTSVEINAIGTNTAYTLVSKHVAGGTTGYAVTDSATGIGKNLQMAKDAKPATPATAGVMPTGYDD